MKKFLLYTLVVIKNATIIIPFFEGMISALVNMIEQDNKKKEKQNAQKTTEQDEQRTIESVDVEYGFKELS